MGLGLITSGNTGNKEILYYKSKEAKEKYLEEKCKDIEVQMRNGSRDAAYKSIEKYFNDY